MAYAKTYLVGPPPGEALTLKEIAKRENVTLSAIRQRLRYGKPLLARTKAKATPIRRKEDEWPMETERANGEQARARQEDEPWLEEWSEK